MVLTAAAYEEGPISFRYPRGNSWSNFSYSEAKILPIGQGRLLREGTKLAIIAFGTVVKDALEAAEILENKGISTTVFDARFAKPLDKAALKRLAKEHEAFIMIEEGAVGGFSSQVLHFFATEGLLDGRLKIRCLCLPDAYLNHGPVAEVLQEVGLDKTGIVRTALEIFQ